MPLLWSSIMIKQLLRALDLSLLPFCLFPCMFQRSVNTAARLRQSWLVRWEAQRFEKMPNVHMQLIPFSYSLQACVCVTAAYVTMCVCSFLVQTRRNHKSNHRAKVEGPSPDHSVADDSTPVILDLFQSSGDSSKAILLTQFTSTTIAAGSQPNIFPVLQKHCSPKKIPQLFHPAFDYLNQEKQYSSAAIWPEVQKRWVEIMVMRSLFLVTRHCIRDESLSFGPKSTILFTYMAESVSSLFKETILHMCWFLLACICVCSTVKYYMH